MTNHDLLIIGGGPAGLAAGLYAARARLSVLLIEKEMVGGQMATTELIENYPGFSEGSSGVELAEKMREQAERFGLRIELDEVMSVDFTRPEMAVTLGDGERTGRAAIIATGRRPQLLGVPGEIELRGRGVSYCATCDGPFFRDKRIVVVGGGNSAIEEALYLSRFASEVVVVHRRDKLRADRVLQERSFNNKKMRFVWDSVVTSIEGDGKVEALAVRNVKTGKTASIATDGVFVYVGNLPNTEVFKDEIELDERGYVIVDPELATSARGVFAAGDVRVGPAKQVATAVGDGALAVISAERYLENV
ncbi:MAG: thioredoxin-disulfide reductase [Actinobacteria bacterium]|nr:thioredoxin-disulfide reductase [Actinomycetota bacterium]